jgi:hypothetical protein
MVGSTLWAWKANCGPGQSAAQCEPGLWSVYQGDPAAAPAEDLAPIASWVKYLERIWPRLTAGTLDSYGYDPATGAFSMSASGASAVPAGRRSCETVVYVPGPLSRPPVVTGPPAWTTGPGPYTVSLGWPSP